MDGYLELFDSARYGRAFVWRILAKFLAVVTLIAAFFFLAGHDSRIGERLLGGILLAIGVGVGYWGFRPTYPCPKCSRQMHLNRRIKQGAGGRDLFLACDGCKVCINLKVQEE
jgi:hypothetical protein